MLSQYKKLSEKHLQGLARSLHWVNPNAITLVGIIPQALFFIFMNNHQFGWAVAMLILSPIDMLDGIVARANNKVTAFGAFLDSTMDRVSDFLLIAGFYAAGLINLNLATILLVISYLISYVRSRGELAADGKIKFNVGLIERPERIIFMFLVLVLYLVFPGAMIFNLSITEYLLRILIFLSAITLVQRMIYAYVKL